MCVTLVIYQESLPVLLYSSGLRTEWPSAKDPCK